MGCHQINCLDELWTIGEPGLLYLSLRAKPVKERSQALRGMCDTESEAAGICHYNCSQLMHTEHAESNEGKGSG